MAILYDSWGNPTTAPVPSPSCPYATNMLAANVKTVGPIVSTNQPPFQLYTYLFIASPDGFASDWAWNTYIVSLPLNWNSENAWTGVLRIEQSLFLSKRIVADAILLPDGSLFSASGGFGPADVYSTVYPLTLSPNALYGPNSYWGMGAQVISYNSPYSIVPLGFAYSWNPNQTPGVILIANPNTGRPINDAIGTAYSTTLVSPSGAFRQSDVGLLVTAVPDYMSSFPNSNRVFPQGSMIANYISPNQVTLTLPPMKNFVGVWLSEYLFGVNRSASSNNVPLFTDLNFSWLQIEVVARLLKSKFFASIPSQLTPIWDYIQGLPSGVNPDDDNLIAPATNTPSPTFASLRLRITTSDGGDSGYFYPGNAYVAIVSSDSFPMTAAFYYDQMQGIKAYSFYSIPPGVKRINPITPISSNPNNADWTVRWLQELPSYETFEYYGTGLQSYAGSLPPPLPGPAAYISFDYDILNVDTRPGPYVLDYSINCPDLCNEIINTTSSNLGNTINFPYIILFGIMGDVVRQGTYPDYIFKAYYKYFWIVFRPPQFTIINSKLYSGWGVDVGSDVVSLVTTNTPEVNTKFVDSYSWDSKFIEADPFWPFGTEYKTTSQPYEGKYILDNVYHEENTETLTDYILYQIIVSDGWLTFLDWMYAFVPDSNLIDTSPLVISYVNETVTFKRVDTDYETLVIVPSGSNVVRSVLNNGAIPAAFLSATHEVPMGKYNLYVR
jgi:hypothetical protein